MIQVIKMIQVTQMITMTRTVQMTQIKMTKTEMINPQMTLIKMTKTETINSPLAARPRHLQQTMATQPTGRNPETYIKPTLHAQQTEMHGQTL